MADEPFAKPGRGFRIISSIALAWNLLGVVFYVRQVTMTPEQLAQLPEVQRQLVSEIPPWVIGAYAIAVFGGTLGALVLLLRKSWAVPLFAISLLAIVIQMGYSLFMTSVFELQGPSAAAMPLVIAAVAVFLLWYSISARRKGWLS